MQLPGQSVGPPRPLGGSEARRPERDTRLLSPGLTKVLAEHGEKEGIMVSGL